MSGAYHRRRVSPAPVVAGLVALVVGVLVLRTFGPRYRVGRLLASTPEVTVAEAVALADGPPRYVRIRGRIDAEAEFEDDAHRPLVFRRTRLAAPRTAGLDDFDDHRERVPFEVREGLDGIAVDDAALDAGSSSSRANRSGPPPTSPDRVPAGTAARRPRSGCGSSRSRRSSTRSSLGVPGLDDGGATTASPPASAGR